jgi:Flp pilus assembly protein TadG
MLLKRQSAFVTRCRQGVAAVEFAALAPFIVMLLVGMWEGGRLIEVQQVLNNAAREGARQAAAGQLDATGVGTIVTNYLGAAGLPTGNVTVAVQNNGFPGNPSPPDNNPQNATQLDQLQLTVTMPLSDVRWIALYLVTNANTVLSAQATWSSLKDLPYPPVNYPPPQ